MDEYIKREDALKAIKDLPNVCGCSAIDRSDAEDAIMDCHNADVVPRAELAVTSFRQAARIAALTDEVKMLEAAIAAEIGEKLRGEIVRKIFEEIEKIIDSHEITIGLVYDEGAGATTAIDRINKKIAELKKKYTEK